MQNQNIRVIAINYLNFASNNFSLCQPPFAFLYLIHLLNRNKVRNDPVHSVEISGSFRRAVVTPSHCASASRSHSVTRPTSVKMLGGRRRTMFLASNFTCLQTGRSLRDLRERGTIPFLFICNSFFFSFSDIIILHVPHHRNNNDHLFTTSCILFRSFLSSTIRQPLELSVAADTRVAQVPTDADLTDVTDGLTVRLHGDQLMKTVPLIPHFHRNYGTTLRR